MADVQRSINKLRELLTEIKVGSPQAVEAIQKIDFALNLLSTSGALTLSARQYRQYVSEIIRGSFVAASEVDALAKKFSRLFKEISTVQVSAGMAPASFLGFTEQLRRAQSESEVMARYSKFEPLLSRYSGFSGIQRLAERTAISPQRYDPQDLLRTFFKKDPLMGGISPFIETVRTAPQDLENVRNAINDINQTFSKMSQEANRAEGAYQKFNEVLKATSNYVNSFRNADVPFEKLAKAVSNLKGFAPTTSLADFFSKTIGADEAEKVVQRILKVAQEYGMTLDNIKSISREASTGITRIQFTAETPLEGRDDFEEQIMAVENLNLTLSKTGQILNDTQKRFRSFASAVVRDIGEVIKWAVAVSVVYAPLRKLQDLIREMIQNQAQLAEIQVITAGSAEEVYKSFSKVADIASTTGNSVLSTLESYKMAYVASGNIKDSNLRAAVSSKLLADSLILSKLSSLSAVESMDILSATLKQLNMDLTQGSVLLDKWVAVSKQANVDLATLATSFAIISSAGENVGLTIDQMNGIIASTAEVSKMSAKETGNMIRAFISGYQTESAVNELAKFGIATRDSEGNLRGFMEVFKEIKELSSRGLISESQLARISEILGGGARRGAQLAAFISNLNRIGEVEAVSQLAGTGEALRALQIRMETVDSTSNALRVSFSKLAQAVGQEGGILTSIIQLNKFLTGLTDAMTSLTKALGASLPTLILAGSSLAFLGANKQAAFGLKEFLGRIGYGVGRLTGTTLFGLGAKGLGASTFKATSLTTGKPFSSADEAIISGVAASSLLDRLSPMVAKEGREAAGETMGARFASFLQRNSKWVLPAAFIFSSSVSAAFEKDFPRVGANLAGAVIGGLAGSRGLSKAFGADAGPIGAMIGIAAFNALLNAARNSADLEAAFAERMTWRPEITGEDKVKTALDAMIEERDRIRRQLEADAAKSTSVLGQAVAFNLSSLRRYGIEATGIFRNIFNLTNTLKYNLFDLFTDIGNVSYDQFALEMAFQFANEEIVEKYKDLNQKIIEYNQATQDGIILNTSSAVEDLVKLYKKDTDAYIAEQKRKLFEGVNEGITPSTFKEKTEALSGIGLKTAQFFAEIGDEFSKAIGKTKNLSDSYTALSDVLLEVSPQESRVLVGYLATLDILKEKYGENSQEVKALKDELSGLLALLYKQQTMARFTMPTLIEGPFKPEEVDLILEKAREYTKNLYTQLLPDPSLVPDFLSRLTPIAVEVSEEAGDKAGKVFWKKYTEVERGMFDKAKKELEDLGLIGTKEINIQTFMDLTKGEFQSRVVPLIREFERIIGESFYGGADKAPRESLGLIFKDGTDKIVVNLLALRLAMDKANELLQKQLDGIFNLPEGAELWVPAQAAELALQTMLAQTGKDTGREFDIDTSKADAKLEELARAANEASIALQGVSTIMDWNYLIQQKAEQLPEEGRRWLEKMFGPEPLPVPRRLSGVAGVRDIDERTVREGSNRRGLGRGERFFAQPGEVIDPGNLPYIKPPEDKPMSLSEVTNLVVTSITNAFNALADNLAKSFGKAVFPINPQKIETISPRSIFIPTNTQPVSKVDLTVNTTSQVNLDGRLIALAIKRYLARDLRVAAGGRTSTNNFFV